MQCSCLFNQVDVFLEVNFDIVTINQCKGNTGLDTAISQMQNRLIGLIDQQAFILAGYVRQ